MHRPHDIPLSRQALAVPREIWDVSQGDLVLPSIRSNAKPLSDNAMNSALRRMGYAKDEMTAHGFRSTASTILNERGHNPDGNIQSEPRRPRDQHSCDQQLHVQG